MQPQRRRARLLTQFSGRLPPGYDWRKVNHPDYDRFFRGLNILARDFEITVFSTYAIDGSVPETVRVIRLDRPRGPGTIWHMLTRTLARVIGLSGINWEEVCSANAPGALWRLIRLMRSADIYYAVGAPERAWLLNAAARLSGCKVAQANYDDYMLSILAERRCARGWRRHVIFNLKAAIAYTAMRLALRQAHVVTASTPAFRDMLRERYGIRTDRIVMLRPTVNEAVSMIPDLRASLGAAERDVVVVYMGNFDTLANREALKLAQTEIAPTLAADPRIKILILGRVPDELRCSVPNMLYAGFVKDINAYLAIADIGWSPVWTTGGFYETKVIQYLAAGLPVVCAAERGNRFDTDAVEMTPARDMAAAIMRLAGDCRRRTDLRKKATDYYRANFSNAVAEHDLLNLSARLRQIAGIPNEN